MKTIFVQIASYRDPELPATLRSCLSMASHPQRLRFGICWQYDDETSSDLNEYMANEHFRIDRVHYSESRGCCWARNRTNLLFRDEQFTLQIDAHMRFEEGWDEKIISMFESIGNEKAILTTYPPPYTLKDGEAVLNTENGVQKIRLKKLRLDLTTLQEGCPPEQVERPGKSEFLAAGYLFTRGQFCHDVEYDPNIYFLGEEISLAARAYTHGYDLYYPHQNLIWHRYNHDSPLHWTDHEHISQDQQKIALKRLEQLLLGDHMQLGKYGLGSVRTLAEYEHYANIRFAEVIDRRNKMNEAQIFHKRIKLNTFAIEPRQDYELWIFTLLNEEGEEIYRLDITHPDILSHKIDTLEINEEIDGVPVEYMLWTRTTEGWGPKFYYSLENELPEKQRPEKNLPQQNDYAEKIFIALAAYREPELRQTIQSCLDNATRPDRLRFGICLQYDGQGVDEIKEDCIDDLLENNDTIRILKFPYTASQGGCWARNIVQSLYRDEEYTLQIDSHSRMVTGWDEILINMMKRLPSQKPLITGFPPLYHINEGKEEFTDVDDLSRVPTTLISSWAAEGWVHHPTEYIPENNIFPRRTRVISGAFVFTLGQWNIEVNQDPDHLYTGEEFALTLRSYTSGYDLFNPDQIVVWHRCHPQPNRKYINDFETEQVRQRHDHAVGRLQLLLAGDPQQELAPFSLGRERTLEDYRVFSGLDCKTMQIHEDARNGVPPNPVTLLDEYKPEGAHVRENTGNLIDMTVQLADMETLELQCENHSPVVGELIAALEANAVRQAGDKNSMIFLQYADNEDHEIYFLQSHLVSLQLTPVKGS